MNKSDLNLLIFGLVMILVSVCFQLFNSVLDGPYMVIIYLTYVFLVDNPGQDEIFHIPQAKRFCAQQWTEYDDKITTPPGLWVYSFGSWPPDSMLSLINLDILFLTLSFRRFPIYETYPVWIFCALQKHFGWQMPCLVSGCAGSCIFSLTNEADHSTHQMHWKHWFCIFFRPAFSFISYTIPIPAPCF